MALASRHLSHSLLVGKSPPPPLLLQRHPHRPRLQRVQTITYASLSNDIELLEDTIVVAGGGPAGLAAALALHKVGMQTLVLERSPSLPTTGAALGLWTNAWKALDALGAGNRLRELHPVVSDVQLCRQDGRVLRKFSLNDCVGGPHEFRGVRRASLVQALAEQLPEELIQYNAEVVEVRPVRISPSVSGGGDANSSQVSEQGNNEGVGAEVVLRDGRVLRCAAVVGCDGARSPTAMSLGKPPPNYVGQVGIRGIAPIREGESPESIRQIWSYGPRAGMYPLSSTELYWFIAFDAPADAPVPATPAEIAKEAAAVVKGWQWNLEKIVAATPPENLSRSRIGDRWVLAPDSPLLRFAKGSQQREDTKERNGGIVGTLAGDALHPMTPNLGQGGCCALEDGVVLARLVRKSGAQQLRGAARREALESVFLEYEKQRSARCLPLVVRSHLMGAVLQLPFPPVSAARDWLVVNKFDPTNFLNHATFDCGSL